jgi:hypothetical protein
MTCHAQKACLSISTWHELLLSLFRLSLLLTTSNTTYAPSAKRLARNLEKLAVPASGRSSTTGEMPKIEQTGATETSLFPDVQDRCGDIELEPQAHKVENSKER